MKTIIITLAILCATSTNAFAQKLTKSERKAKKMEQIQQNEAAVKKMYDTKSFTFVPTEFSTNASKPFFIEKYESLIIKPNYLNMELTIFSPQQPNAQFNRKLTILTPLFEIMGIEKTAKGYTMIVKTETNEQNYTFTFNTNAQNSSTTMQVVQSEGNILNYKGAIYPN